MQFGTGIFIKGPCQRGGYTSCRFLVVKNTRIFSKNIRPKRSLNARLGHSKKKTQDFLGYPCFSLFVVCFSMAFPRIFFDFPYDIQTLSEMCCFLIKCIVCDSPECSKNFSEISKKFSGQTYSLLGEYTQKIRVSHSCKKQQCLIRPYKAYKACKAL